MLVVVGKNSFLAKNFCKFLEKKINYISITHQEIHKLKSVKEISAVINFSVDPKINTNDYREINDVDSEILKILTNTDIHYTMISSRLVYSSNYQWNSCENDPCSGLNTYGKNKSIIEKSLLSIRSNNLLILRVGSIMGFDISADLNRARLSSFLLKQLIQNGTISLSISGLTKKDIITLDYFNKSLFSLINKKISGVFNLGSGHSVTVNDISEWLLKGYISGEPGILLANTNTWINNEYQLNCEKVSAVLKTTFDTQELEAYCIMLGRLVYKERIKINPLLGHL